jgi:hypothetical protein
VRCRGTAAPGRGPGHNPDRGPFPELGYQDFYCPELEWVWDDGARSVRQSDCEPADPETKIERHFSARHSFQAAGEYDVTLRLRRADRVITQASAALIVVASAAR